MVSGQNKDYLMSEFYEKLKLEYGENLSGQTDKLQLKVSHSHLSLIAGNLKHKHGFIFLSDIIAVDYKGQEDKESRFTLLYQLINLEEFCHLCIEVEISELTKVDSVSSIWPAARRLEIDARDMIGIKFKNDLGKGFLNPEDFGGYPLQKDFSPKIKSEILARPTSFPTDSNIDTDQKGVRSWVNIGPHHPVMKNKIRMILELEGEYIRRSQYETGFYHRGFEKQCRKI